MKQTETIHIECQIRKEGLFILGAQQLIKSGLKPILFRYSIRTSRHGRKTDKTKRTPMAKRRGWHRFFDSEKLTVTSKGQILFRDDSKDADPLKPTYLPTPQHLFTYIKEERDTATNNISAIKLPYGQKSYDILERPHYFTNPFPSPRPSPLATSARTSPSSGYAPPHISPKAAHSPQLSSCQDSRRTTEKVGQ